MKKIIISFLFVTFFSIIINAQDWLIQQEMKEYTPPDELVTLSANLSFNEAINLLSQISEKKTGKPIVSLVDRKEPIGIEIDKMQYKKAFMIIVQFANLMFEEKPEVIVVKSKTPTQEEALIQEEGYVSPETREVKISAIFVDLDTEGLRERGVNWQVFLSKRGLDIGVNMNSTSQTQATAETQAREFSVNTDYEFDYGGFFGEALSFFKFLESENLAEVIASPSITVKDKVEGRIQVGSDFSIKQRDFAGNIIDVFFSTGSIIKVTPAVFKKDSLNYILLNLQVERSTGFPSELSTEIKKTQAQTQVLMLDGEETVIGGLYSNEQRTERVGIPVLKDLPWWFFGLRYLFGSDRVSVIKKELVILIKVDLIPTLQERLSSPNKENKVAKELQDYRNKVKYYQFNNKEK